MKNYANAKSRQLNKTKKFHNDETYRLNLTKKYIIFMTMTNIDFTPKNMLVRLALTGPPALAHKLARAWTPAQPC